MFYTLIGGISKTEYPQDTPPNVHGSRCKASSARYRGAGKLDASLSKISSGVGVTP